MAGDAALELKIRRRLRGVDDEALATLASRGLVRRARVELERVAAEVAGVRDGRLCVRLGEREVAIGEEGPSGARCDCPAPGVCHHVVAACLLLRGAGDEPSQALAEGEAAPARVDRGEAGAALERELLGLDRDALARFCGRPGLRAALRQVAEAAPAEIESGEALVVRLPGAGLEVRFLPELGLDGAIASGPARERKKRVVAAVLALQRARGAAWEEPPAAPAALAEVRGAPRGRRAILEATRGLLEELVAAGLAHLPEAAAQRLATLSLSATHANLPRLGRELRSLSDEVELLLARHARADAARLFERLARGYALARALEGGLPEPAPALVGRHRSRYEAAGDLELVGVGATAWRTASGFRGLTLHFWCPSARAFRTWSEARPVERSEFDPVARYGQPLPWEGAGGRSAAELSRSRFVLRGARCNEEGRLSSSGGSRVLRVEPTDASLLEGGGRVFEAWQALREHAGQSASSGLREARPLDALVCVRPARWGAPEFEPIEQRLLWPLEDAQGDRLVASVPFAERHRLALEQIEAFDSPRSALGLVGRIVPRAGEIELSPYTILRKPGGSPPLVNLHLDPLERRGLVRRLATRLRHRIASLRDGGADAGDETPDDADAGLAPIAAVEALETALEGVAERGLPEGGRFSPPESLRADLERRGFGLLAEASRVEGAEGLVRARYLCLLHRQAGRAGQGEAPP